MKELSPSPSLRRRLRRRKARVSKGSGVAPVEPSADGGILNRLLTDLESAGRNNDGPKVREAVGELLALPALYETCVPLPKDVQEQLATRWEQGTAGRPSPAP